MFYYLVPKAAFPGRVHFSRLAEGTFSFFLLQGPQGGGVGNTVQVLAPTELRGICSRWAKSRDTASNSGDGVPLPESHLGAWISTRIFAFPAANILFFPLLPVTATAHSSTVRARAARAAAAKKIQQNNRRTMLLESNVARVSLGAATLLLSAHVPVAARPRVARVRLVLVAL